MFQQIGLIGLGLIGGSIAKAIKKKNNATSIVAIDDNQDFIKMAYNDGLIDNEAVLPIEELASCDLIFLCSPIEVNIKYLSILRDIIRIDCIITDVGSIKGEMEEAVNSNNLSANYIGGHPMCGSEKGGFYNSSDHLLENAYYILTNNGKVDPDKFILFQEFIESIGAIPIEMTSDEHDYVTAGISHIPHIISASLVNFVKNNDTKSQAMKTVAAGGFKDITRISSSNPKMWQNICISNRDKIIELIDRYIGEINSFKASIIDDESDTLNQLFDDAKEYRDSISTGNGILPKSYEFYLDIADEPGAIATIATMLAANALSIKNIGIINNREFEDGVLRIEMYDESSKSSAIDVLTRNHYIICR